MPKSQRLTRLKYTGSRDVLLIFFFFGGGAGGEKAGRCKGRIVGRGRIFAVVVCMHACTVLSEWELPLWTIIWVAFP